MRHVLFGSAAEPKKLYIVPESEVYFETTQLEASGKFIIKAIFRGRTISLPIGTQASFIDITHITPVGAIAVDPAMMNRANENVHGLLTPGHNM
jgi:hypothetical protein